MAYGIMTRSNCDDDLTGTLGRLVDILEDRKVAEPESSYVAGLYASGDEGILRKIGEESSELVVAGAFGTAQEIVHEMADLWFHTLVFLSYKGLALDDVIRELNGRFGQSGLAEKAARTQI